MTDLETRIRNLEDHAALKALVDRFSNLADDKQVHEQTFLFTEDATVQTWFGDTALPPLNGRAEIEASWTPFLAGFDTVYHMNGQFTAQVDGDTATATHYCTVELIGGPDGQKTRNSNGVIYHDQYRRVKDEWLITRREARFTWRDVHPYAAA
ncbi:MAG: nuclear transport factor 2 family protein [Paracoccus sp. (in: a-proteobacteria)]|uniref:nuclear transport factor 2 family protein n=1 Tax=Paracoccus sp. TaxID=267 RepID=UPI0026DFA078|nr:nuclear transport factor 2 family protein [Paracoccus sp. (in: a-proteobacteria)]MDO5612923.1 nuclear transport factor 2 family protein [Paracoccus sp. (in: a-proteobacteria)]